MNASGPLRKAILINSGTDMTGGDGHVPNNSQGWGRTTLDNSLYFKGDTKKLWLHDDYNGGNGLNTGETWSTLINVKGTQDFKVSLVWNDYPGQGLKNDLNLVVTAPNGDTYIGNNYQNGETVPDAGAQPDNKNPEECVYIKTPQDGTYNIEVTAASIHSGGNQKFAIVATGELNLFTIAINAPATGATLIGGNTCNIDWVSNGGTAPVTVDILFSSDGGVTYARLAASQPQSGQWLWNIPTINTNTARVRAIANDSVPESVQADTGDFTIKVPHTVTLKTPNGSELLTGGSIFPVIWNTSGGTNLKIDLFYSTDGGATFTLIKTNLDDNSSYAWTVPGVDSATVRIRASAVNQLQERVNDTSDGNFSIDSTAPVITVILPSAGAVWAEGVHLLNWSVLEAVGLAANSINISYSKDDGATWMPIASSRPSPNTTYDWNIIMGTDTSKARVRISAYDKIGRTGTGISPGFTIDTTSPAITHTGVKNAVANEPIAIMATVTDTVSVQSVILYYTEIGGSIFSQVNMVSSGSTYSASIPGQTGAGVLKYHICAFDSAGHWAISPATVMLPSNDNNYTMIIKDLSEMGSVSGTVYDAGGYVISGVLITAYLSSSPVNSGMTTSSGTYQITALDPGTYELIANATGYADGHLAGVDVTAGADSPGRDFYLLPWQPPGKWAISGIVLNAKTNASIPYATAVLSKAGGNPVTISASSSGRFVFAGLDPGEYKLNASATNYDSASIDVTVQSGNRENVEIKLDPSVRIDKKTGSELPLNLIFAAVGVVLAVIIIAAVAAAAGRKKKREKKVPAFIFPHQYGTQNLQNYLSTEYPPQFGQPPAAQPVPPHGAGYAAPPSAPDRRPSQGGKVCKRCGKINEKWQVTCAWCKAGLG